MNAPSAPPAFNLLRAADIAAIKARVDWLRTARPKQVPPRGDWDLLIWPAGRSFGKTRCLTEHGWSEAFRVPDLRVHALAPTIGDVRRTLFEGESGFLNKMPRSLLKNYNRSLHEITLINGSRILGFSMTEEADRLRGPQAHLLLMDEAAADGPWRPRLAQVRPVYRSVETTDAYYRILAPVMRQADIWETTYLHVLEGDNPVVEWTKGTALRPYLDALEEPERAAFLAAYAARIAAAYPRQPRGRTRLPVLRNFCIAQK